MKNLIIAGLLSSLWVPATAGFTYPQCTDLASTDFKATEVFSKKQPAGSLVPVDAGIDDVVQMDLHGVYSGSSLTSVDIYFVERLGNVKMFQGATKQVKTLGTLSVMAEGTDYFRDYGLMGLALHPDYDHNHWIYLWYCPKGVKGVNRTLQLSRFTVTSGNTLDMASEKPIIKIKGSKGDVPHAGGPMTFDNHGDLWVTVGNNSSDVNLGSCNVMSTTDSTASAEWSSSNTASLRGGTFRIHPDSSEKGYSVPHGNFGEYWADQWDKQGKTDLAAQYRDTNKVRPEVYIKGDRSNYSIAVHPTKGWLAWGVVNTGGDRDEENIATHPIFAGFPYFQGNNLPGCTGLKMSADAPKNNSPFNSGVKDLPPAVPGTFNWSSSFSKVGNVAMTGPIYVYDRNLISPTKFPPHLDNSWFTFNYAISGAAKMRFTLLDPNDASVVQTDSVAKSIFKNVKMDWALQAKYGPDGALYILNRTKSSDWYETTNPGVVRVDYTGSCVLTPDGGNAVRGQRSDVLLDVTLSQGILTVQEAGDHVLRLYNPAGHLLAERKGSGAKQYSLTELGSGLNLEKGVYLIQVKTARGIFLRSLSLL